jgi:O-antigen/teichoic acid export membrane protein
MAPVVEQLQTPPPQFANRSLAPAVFLTLGSKATILVINALGVVVVARALGPSGRGAIAVAFSFALVLVQFGSLGLQSANPYFAARDPRQINAIVLNTIWGAAAIGVILVACALAGKASFPALLRGLDWLDVVVVAAGLPAMLATQLLQSVFLAEGRMRVYNGVELAGNLIVLVGLVVGLIFLHFGVLGAIAVMVSVNWGMALTFLALQRAKADRFGKPDLKLFRRMLKYGFRVYMTTLVAYLVGRINLILVDSYLGTGQAGVYSIGVAIAEGMHLLPSVVALNLFPRIARGAGFESSAAVFRILCVVFGGFCLLTVPLAGPAIHLLYGPRFSQATEIYYWMLPGIFSYGMLNVLSYHFAGRGFPLEAMLVWFPGLLVNLVLVMVFVPGHHAYMAAFAATIAYMVVLILHVWLFAKESGGYRVLLPRLREVTALVAMLLRSVRPALARR